MIEHKKRFTKKPAAAAPAKSAPAEPAKTVKTAKAEPAKKTAAPAPKPVEAPKPAAAPKVEAKPVATPKVETKPAATPKVDAKTAAPKVEAKPAATPKVEAKTAAPQAEPQAKAAPKAPTKVAALKNNIKSMPEQTLTFFANLMLWASIAVCVLCVLFGVIALVTITDANGPIAFAGMFISAIVILVYALIVWAFTRVFVNISNTLKTINAKLPEPKQEEK